VRHANDEDLDQLESLLAALREIPGLTERKRGIFYRRGKAYLHFHQDPAGLFADVRAAGEEDFSRHAVTSDRQRAQLLKVVRAEAADGTALET
jgi:hypothetical protein